MVFSDNVATLIHDLKTPVIAQERALDLLLQNTFGELNNTQAEIISQIKESCEYLKTLVYSTMDNYISDIKNQRFNIKDLILTVSKDLKFLGDEKKQKFIFNIENIYINTDMFKFQRVITNLLSNAIKYSYENSDIEIYCRKFNKNIVFEIKNYAPEVKNIDRVFDKFESTSNSGLGLYLVKQIIEKNNGKVFAKKENDNKYSFGFVIPNI